MRGHTCLYFSAFVEDKNGKSTGSHFNYLSGTPLVPTFHFSKLAVRTNVTTKGKCVLKGSMGCRENKAVVSKAKVTLKLSLKSSVKDKSFPEG